MSGMHSCHLFYPCRREANFASQDQPSHKISFHSALGLHSSLGQMQNFTEN